MSEGKRPPALTVEDLRAMQAKFEKRLASIGYTPEQWAWEAQMRDLGVWVAPPGTDKRRRNYVPDVKHRFVTDVSKLQYAGSFAAVAGKLKTKAAVIESAVLCLKVVENAWLDTSARLVAAVRLLEKLRAEDNAGMAQREAPKKRGINKRREAVAATVARLNEDRQSVSPTAVLHASGLKVSVDTIRRDMEQIGARVPKRRKSQA